MKKRTLVIFSVATIAVVAFVVVGYFAYTSAETAKQSAMNEEYQKENEKEVGIGETLILNSSSDSEGIEYGYKAAFDWTGTMEATLVSAAVFDSPSEAGINDSELLGDSNVGEMKKFLVCELKIHNVDADVSQQLGENFNISIFQLHSNDIPSLPPDPMYLPEYFDGGLQGIDETDVYYYTLGKGQEKIFKLGYFVTEQAIDEGLFYMIGASGGASKYLINVVVE